MQPGQIQLGQVYQVWMNRKLRPVLIQRRNVHGGWVGIMWPNGRHVTIRDPKKISDYHTMQRSAVDFKSRAAGEREE